LFGLGVGWAVIFAVSEILLLASGARSERSDLSADGRDGGDVVGMKALPVIVD
jgi:hypothetical protein